MTHGGAEHRKSQQPVEHDGEIGHRFARELLRGNDDGFLLIRMGQPSEVDPAGADTVLDVMHGIGDVVGPIHDLGLQAAPAVGRAERPDPLEHRGVVGVHPEFAAR